MASRLGQHLLKAKSKAENFGLFALSLSLLFFVSAVWLHNGQFLTVIEDDSPNINHCIWAIYFWAQRCVRGLGCLYLHLIQCPVGFDHNAITHLATHPKLKKTLSPY